MSPGDGGQLLAISNFHIRREFRCLWDTFKATGSVSPEHDPLRWPGPGYRLHFTDDDMEARRGHMTGHIHTHTCPGGRDRIQTFICGGFQVCFSCTCGSPSPSELWPTTQLEQPAWHAQNLVSQTVTSSPSEFVLQGKENCSGLLCPGSSVPHFSSFLLSMQEHPWIYENLVRGQRDGWWEELVCKVPQQ